MRYTHTRAAWQNPAQPVHSTNAFEWSDVDLVVVHYTAADDLIDGDPGEHASDLDNFLRNTQNFYVTRRGYSIGYNVAVDWLGGSWELRGTSFECAANYAINHRAFAILALVDGADPTTPLASATIRDLVAQARAESGRRLTIIGHQEGTKYDPEATPTACPGVGIMSQIRAGTFEPGGPPPPPPVTAPVIMRSGGGSPSGQWTGWYRRAGSVVRTAVPNMTDARWLTNNEAAVDAKTLRRPVDKENWSDVSWVATHDHPDLDRYVGPLTVAPPPPPPPPPSTPYGRYTVRSGDSWWSIAELFDVDINLLAASNGLPTTAVIHPGQVLLIPGLKGYVVKSGDGWWKIGQLHGMTTDQVLAVNPPATVNTVLHPGQVVNVK